MKRSARNIKWIETHCRIPDGKFVGQPFKLTRKQKEWMVKIYDSPTRTFILSMARKNAKTATTAAWLILHLAGPEARTNGQLYSSAQTRDQAAVLFKYAAKIIRFSPTLSQYIQIKDSAKELHCTELGTVYKALSSDGKAQQGLNPCFIVHDELGQVSGPTYDMYEALESATGAQVDPITVIISTQAAKDGDLLSILIDDAATGIDSTVKLELHTTPLDAPPFEEDSIRLANPHYDEIMDRKSVLKMAKDASRMPSMEADYRNKVLNQRIEDRNPFVTKSIWDENGADPEPLDGQDVYGGLDLSSVSDLTALTLVSTSGDVHCDFWLPRDGLAEKSRQDRVPYDVWHGQGLLNTTPGRAIEYEYIAMHLRRVFDRCNVIAIAFDRYNMKFLKPWLEKVGFTADEIETKFIEFGQGFVSMSPAIRELEAKLLMAKLRHGKHPVLAMCAANAKVVMDPAGNRKFIKGKEIGRIDGMVALAMAVGVMPTELSGPSVYEERGIYSF